MTADEYNALPEGVSVWFRPPYFAFAMPATVRIAGGRRCLWVNFYGDGQCLFAPQDGRKKKFASWVSSGEIPATTLMNHKKQL